MTPPHIATAFRDQSIACRGLGSPFMGQLMRLFADMPWPKGNVRNRVFDWVGDISPAGQSVPLRLAGALHALHLRGHATLALVYPPRQADDASLWAAICRVLVDEATHINAWLDSAPQTNEVRRSAVLIAVGHILADRYALPIRTSELGASGGLNLHWDRYALDLGDIWLGPDDAPLTLGPQWHGPPPPNTPPRVVSRAGVDLQPLNPGDRADALRLQACLWPDQPDRLTLARAAIAAARTPVTQGDAIDWLSTRLTHQTGEMHLIYSTVAWQYFPQQKQEIGTRMIAAAGANATDETPLAWFGMENDGTGEGAALTLRLWPGEITLDLGRADFHGRWVKWGYVS